MFAKVVKTILFADVCSENEPQEAKFTIAAKFVLMENGRLVPVEPGGMVEVALNELGAKIVEVEIPSGEKVNRED